MSNLKIKEVYSTILAQSILQLGGSFAPSFLGVVLVILCKNSRLFCLKKPEIF